MIHKKLLRFVVFTCFLFLLVLARSGIATVVEQISDQELVQKSASIITGTVTKVFSEWNSEKTQIHTIVELSVDSLIKGYVPDDIIQLRVLGGTVGDTTLWIVNSPVYELNDDVLLFLRPNLNSPFPVVGFNQGKMSLEVNPLTGQKIIRERQIPLNEFLGEIRDIMDNQRGGE
jgi:Na+-transporting methylmalonyl-CoA/oxaloacetate decarboxylase gamma subunit